MGELATFDKMANMKRVLLSLGLCAVLALSGCAADRKKQLESELPALVTKEMQRVASTSNTNGAAVCKQVILTQESKGHYVGTAYFTDGRQTQVKVIDDGQSYNVETAPF